MPAKRLGGLALLGGFVAAAPAHANPASIVPSAADPGDPIDLNVRVDYEYSIERSTIAREAAGEDVDPLGPLPKHRDLAFKQLRHLIVPRAELGVFRNAWLSVALPIVILQQREIDLADGVTRDGSSTLREGLVPAEGFDAREPGAPLDGDGVFRGVDRKGLDQLHLGAGVALMNQEKDDTKPTWKLAAEVRVPVGRVMRFDAMAPGDERGVGRGVYELRLSTSVARRYARTEAWFEMHWQAPIAEKQTSLLRLDEADRFGATNVGLGQQAGLATGVELYAYDDAADQNRVSLDLGGRAVAHFEGRAYTELWELFAYAGDERLGGLLVLDADPTVSGVQARSHPGVTNVENHLELTGRAAVRAQLGRFVRFAATLDVIWKNDHLITFADAGIDRPTCGTGSGLCETDENDVVSAGTAEVNPLHAPRIDLTGHRYHAQDNLGFAIGVQGHILF